jgi:hypothetical protein
VVKGVGEVGKKALDLPRAVGGFKKALEAKRAKKKLAWLGKRKYRRGFELVEQKWVI